MAPILYHQDASPPSRAVRMVAAALNIPLELKSINLLTKEHYKPEYTKINPQHTLPCLDDDGFILWDSHAIIVYLIEKYVKNETSLYPRDLKIRSKINQRNHFDTGEIFARFREIIGPLLYKSIKQLNPITLKSVAKSYAFIEAFLEDSQYLCGNNITIADISCATTVEMLQLFVPIPTKLVKTLAWLERVTKYPPFAEVVKQGQVGLQSTLKSVL